MSTTINKTCPISLTAGAVAELKSIISSENEKNPLRIGVKNGGCAGFSYILNFEEADALDESFIIDGINIVIDPLHIVHLKNLEIDFEQGLNNRGFIYNNPNADTTCGCGTSFS